MTRRAVPASPASVALTDAYRTTLLHLRLQATAMTARAWRSIDPANLDGTFPVWLQAAVAVTQGAKLRGVAQADAYLAAYLRAETGRDFAPRGVDPEPYLVTEQGKTMAQALTAGVIVSKMALGSNRDPATALRLGLTRVSRIIANEVLGAPRRALHDLAQDTTDIGGWRRVSHAGACGACLALTTGEILPTDQRLMVHGDCRCVVEFTINGVREQATRPTGREIFDAMTPLEQAAMFHGRGGEAKADLIRSGAVPFESLVHHQEQNVGPPTFTEASLSALSTPGTAATVGH